MGHKSQSYVTQEKLFQFYHLTKFTSSLILKNERKMPHVMNY